MYNRFVNAFIDAQTESLRLYREVVRAEAAVFGASYAGQVVRVPTTGEIVNELRVVYESVITRIIDRARTQYAVGRARPVVNRAAVCKEAGIDIDRAMAMDEVPDFDRLWETLDVRLQRIGGGQEGDL